jgi:eukaryotic-like serine/threonine-protein kinase
VPASTRSLAGRYRLDRLLGEGGMASVWQALDERLGRDVAIKVVRPDAADPAAVARFDREARVVAGLRHPGVVLVHDYGVDDGSPFLVMELLPGPSLARVVADEAPLEVGRATAYVREAAAALAAAHAAGVVHRDVKPGNLVLDAHDRVRVVDFGIARVEREADATLTAAGHVVGSAAYLAPEQAAGGPVDHRVDLYSLGCVLVALLTGGPPFSGASPVAVAAQHLHADPPDLAVLRPDVPEALARLAQDLLSKEPGRRPATAQEVVERLGDLASADDATAVVPDGRAAGQDPSTTAFLPGAAAAAAATTAAAGAGASTAACHRPAADERLDTRRVALAAAAVVALVGLLAAAVALGFLPGGDDPGADAARPAGTPPVVEEEPAAEPTPEPDPDAAAGSEPAPVEEEPVEEEPVPPDEPDPADPETALAGLRSAVEGLRTEGPDRKGERELLKEIDRVESAVRDGDRTKARDRLEDLEEEVEDLVDDGRLSGGSGQVVLDAADSLRSALRTLDGGSDRDRDDDD